MTKMVIDLNGPSGNAFVLLAYAKKLCEHLDMDFTDVTIQLTEGDYDHLIKKFEELFGDHVEFLKSG